VGANLTERRFLAFVGNAPIGAKLTEGRFRELWDRTADTREGNATPGAQRVNAPGARRRRGHFSPFASFMSSRPSSGWPSSQDGSDEQIFGAK
jgi:hypothetical protein